MLYDNEKFIRNGRTFRAQFPYDDTHEAPWEREDGRCLVSDWTTRDKLPGERLLCADRTLRRYYDFQAAVIIAKRDGWGLTEADTAKLTAKLGRTPKRGDIAAESVRHHFDYLRRWCNNHWCYVGVVVRCEDSDDTASLWGIESDATEYLETVAYELADEICERLDAAMALSIAEARPDLSPSYS